MKRKRSLKRRSLRRSKKKSASKLTLEQVVTAAVAAGAKVSISLPPLQPVPPERPRLKVPSNAWPGTPCNRTILASMEVTEKDIARAFKDTPSDRWVITPYEIVDRNEFFKPKPAPTP